MSNFQGKGSRHRSHDKQKFNDNFDKIFKQDKPKKVENVEKQRDK